VSQKAIPEFITPNRFILPLLSSFFWVGMNRYFGEKGRSQKGIRLYPSDSAFEGQLAFFFVLWSFVIEVKTENANAMPKFESYYA